LKQGERDAILKLSRSAMKKGNGAMSGNQDEDRLQRIRETAYALWEKEGMPEGREHEFWLRAERIVDGTEDHPGHPTSESDEKLDSESADSFPASDPPSFNP
jgi:hypothetical protein